MGEDQEGAARPLSVVPASVARRRMRLVIGVLGLVWVGAICGLVGSYRGHDMPIFACWIGQLVAVLVARVWLGYSRSPVLAEEDDRTYMSARTMVGVRTVDLSDLVWVRYAGPVGKDETPKDRTGWWIRDGQGMRLAFRPSLKRGPALEEALRQAVRRADRPVDMNLATSDRLTLRRLTAGYQASGPDVAFLTMAAVMVLSPLSAILLEAILY